ncbi:PstS family phosphate ABC transporter substrate-binding protein [Streptomyces sp. NPDC048172]|uniref:PstS family phosphate ABC transporter substrate-binding protein n=1 Tax=Streptomyces sp. NPDC048172 TaxID=3365505 RepID=UPI003711C929
MNASRRPSGIVRAAVLTSVATFTLSACWSAGAGTDDGKELLGKVMVDGSSTVAPLAKAAAELYAEKQPKVRVSVGTSGTGGGFKKLCSGHADISDASRLIKAKERAACAERGVKYEEFSVANDALTVVVNKRASWVDCLSTRQLKKIWQPGSRIHSWKQVDPSFPDVPLKLYGPGSDSGTFDYFTKAINGTEGASRADYTSTEDDNVTVRGVSRARGGMGYFGFSYFEENENELKSVMIDSGDGCVVPSVTSVQNGTYKPLSRPLFIYPTAKALKRPEVEDFVEYFVEHHAQITAGTQFIPLNSQQEDKLRDDLKKLKAAAG